jgi:hypothetical protein
MRKLMLLVSVFVLTGSLFSADAPMIGIWEINIAKSRIPAGSKAANFKEGITVFREIENDLIEGVSTETQQDGKIIVSKSTFPKGGGFRPINKAVPLRAFRYSAW